MARKFNTQRSNDSRPSLRNTSSNRNEEQPSRPARSRLSREVVDRAWENGAQNRHADYHPRASHNSGTRQNAQNSGYPQRNRFGNNQESRGHTPYGGAPRQQNDGFNRTPARGNYRSNNSSPYQSRDYGRTPYSPEGRERRTYNDAPRGRTPYNPNGGERRTFNDAPRGRAPYNPEGRERRTYNDAPRSRAPYSQDGRERRGYDAPRGRTPYNPNGGERRGYNRYGSSGNNAPRQARPPLVEQFEGDYEQFSDHNEEIPTGDSNSEHNPGKAQEERHVTRMADGRVIKGPRPQQRRQARFWEEVSEDTEQLLDHIPVQPKVVEAPTPKKREKRSAASTEKKKGKTAQAGTTGYVPKPSQKGFKWPTS